MGENETKVVLQLNINDVNKIISIASKQPYDVVFELIDNIRNQAIQQLNVKPEEPHEV